MVFNGWTVRQKVVQYYVTFLLLCFINKIARGIHESVFSNELSKTSSQALNRHVSRESNSVVKPLLACPAQTVFKNGVNNHSTNSKLGRDKMEIVIDPLSLISKPPAVKLPEISRSKGSSSDLLLSTAHPTSRSNPAPPVFKVSILKIPNH